MTAPELAQLEMLAEVDELVHRLSRFAEQSSPWEAVNRCRALIRRLLTRIETLRIRLESPLVVATFGGTGTGKSTLVNALVGRDCTTTGRQRPTTTKPVLIVHPQTELEALGLPLDDFKLSQIDSPILRDIVIIDCPDPDTTETETRGTNLQLLHQLLPYCDVLIYTSTQQKYRSARVLEELGQAATGCRLLFVQTHADLDEDIRDDWRSHLAERYDVPEMFFVDSVRGLREQQAGQRPSGDLARLQDLLTTHLSASQRIRIRRANLVDLLHAGLEHCRRQLDQHHPAVEQLTIVLEEQRHKLTASMSAQLRDELLVSRHLWERRLIESVTRIWGSSPFSSVLRFYNSIGNFVASFTLFRARTSAQMALIGALQGIRWVQSRQQEREAEDQLNRLASFGLDDATLQESQFVISGYVKSARLDPSLIERTSLGTLRTQAARVEGQFLGDASRRIDEIIEGLAARNSRRFTRFLYELLFLLLIGFVLYRIGRNFFVDSFLYEQPLLPSDFYISAAVLFVLWTGFLVMFFTRRLRRGLRLEIEELADELAATRLSDGLFPQLEQVCRDWESTRSRLDTLSAATSDLRYRIAASPALGAPLAAEGEPISVLRPETEGAD